MINKINSIIQLAIGIAVVLLGLLVLIGVLDIAPKSRTPILFVLGGIIIVWACRTMQHSFKKTPEKDNGSDASEVIDAIDVTDAASVEDTKDEDTNMLEVSNEDSNAEPDNSTETESTEN